MGDREKYLHDALIRIQQRGCTVTRTSSIYKTAPWGKTDQPEFLNQVIGVSTELNARELLNMLLQVETDLGRTRKEKWGERSIDLDILFFHNQIINLEGLTIPHPGIASRRFTLVPLCEIAFDFIHPVWMKSCQSLLDTCTDTSVVEKYKI